VTVNWETWTPTERANLCFIFDGGRVLLIRKKRGLGAGKVNGPGGKLEPGETALDAAERETFEEVCVRPVGARQLGDLRFQFVDGYGLHCAVFRADGFDGEPAETDEATPFWAALSSIPYGEMWADDARWFPYLIDGRTFTGRFVFDGERMLDHWVEADIAPLRVGP
jgi:8-oxo-dGTP diphosphatase